MASKNFSTIETMKYPNRFLEWDQVKKLINYARQDNFRNYLILRLLLGRRVSEVVRENGIRPIDIRPPNTIMFTILKRKERKRYPITVDRDLVEKIRGYIRAKCINDHDPIFKISRQRVFQIVRKYGKACGLLNVGDGLIHPHHLRHSYAIWKARQAKNPMDIYDLKDELKHTDVNMTMWYLSTFRSKHKDTGIK